jgi:hypothetical protein
VSDETRVDGIRVWPGKRLAQIMGALAEDDAVVGFIDPADVTLVEEKCDYCGWRLEWGHCYTCQPVWSYGEKRMPKPGSKAMRRA